MTDTVFANSEVRIPHEVINWVALPHCPEGQLVKAHETDAGWDIKAAQTTLVKPYSQLPYSWEDFDLLEAVSKDVSEINNMHNVFLSERGLRVRSKVLLDFNEPFSEIQETFRLFEVTPYKDEYLLNLKGFSYDLFLKQYGSLLKYADQVSVLQRKKVKPILIKTGIQVQPQSLRWNAITLRSSMTKYGVTMHHSVGVIDYEYTGEIFVAVTPLEDNLYTIFGKGERIAQLIPMEQRNVSLTQVDKLDETLRGAGGFGSSGSKDLIKN